MLSELDPVACLKRLNALVSPHPYDLEPVRPAVDCDGVDAVAVNNNAVFGGMCIIQAKRYRGAVGVEAIRALT